MDVITPSDFSSNNTEEETSKENRENKDSKESKIIYGNKIIKENKNMIIGVIAVIFIGYFLMRKRMPISILGNLNKLYDEDKDTQQEQSHKKSKASESYRERRRAW